LASHASSKKLFSRSPSCNALFPARSSDGSNGAWASPTQRISGSSNAPLPQDWTVLAPQSDGLFVAASRADKPP
jgi:hypothetical protein